MPDADSPPPDARKHAVPGEPHEPAEPPEDWVNVRDSWVGSNPDLLASGVLPPRVIPPEPPPPSSARPKSQPPPLPPESERAPLLRASQMPVAPEPPRVEPRRVQLMLELLAASDYEGALRCAEAILRRAPDHSDAEQCASICRSELYKTYDQRLGSRDRIPWVAMRPAELRAMSIDTQAGLVLSLVNGSTTIDEIVAFGPSHPLDTLRILSELYLQGVIELEGAG